MGQGKVARQAGSHMYDLLFVDWIRCVPLSRLVVQISAQTPILARLSVTHSSCISLPPHARGVARTAIRLTQMASSFDSHRTVYFIRDQSGAGGAGGQQDQTGVVFTHWCRRVRAVGLWESSVDTVQSHPKVHKCCQPTV